MKRPTLPQGSCRRESDAPPADGVSRPPASSSMANLKHRANTGAQYRHQYRVRNPARTHTTHALLAIGRIPKPTGTASCLRSSRRGNQQLDRIKAEMHLYRNDPSFGHRFLQRKRLIKPDLTVHHDDRLGAGHPRLKGQHTGKPPQICGPEGAGKTIDRCRLATSPLAWKALFAGFPVP